MNRVLITLLFCLFTNTAWADRVCWVNNDNTTSCREGDGKMSAPEVPVVVPTVAATGIPVDEFECLTKVTTITQSPDPISDCQVPDKRIPQVMDQLVKWYNFRHERAVAWVQDHCIAQAAIPRNKWVCTVGDVTREYD